MNRRASAANRIFGDSELCLKRSGDLGQEIIPLQPGAPVLCVRFLPVWRSPRAYPAPCPSDLIAANKTSHVFNWVCHRDLTHLSAKS